MRFNSSADHKRDYTMPSVKRLHRADANKMIESINRLLPQLSPSGDIAPLTTKELTECLENKNFRLFIIDGFPENDAHPIHGMGSIFFQKNLKHWIAEIHDIIVDRDHREHGLGKIIIARLIKEAKTFASLKKRPIKLYLTSRPNRIAANVMYCALGFTMIASANGNLGTNLYIMVVNPENQSTIPAPQ